MARRLGDVTRNRVVEHWSGNSVRDKSDDAERQQKKLKANSRSNLGERNRGSAPSRMGIHMPSSRYWGDVTLGGDARSELDPVTGRISVTK